MTVYDRFPLDFVLICNILSFAVLYPTRFLEGEDGANNFLFNADR